MNTNRAIAVATIFAALAAAPARAEVVEVSETGFTVKEAVTVSVPPEKAYAAFVAIGKWWDSAHTFSGDAANLSIDAEAAGLLLRAACRRRRRAAPDRRLRLAGQAPRRSREASAPFRAWASPES